jgi:hypothetical protein
MEARLMARRLPKVPDRYGKQRDLPPLTRALAESVSSAESAADGMMASMAARIGDTIRSGGPGVLTEERAAQIREEIRFILDGVYGSSRERAGHGELGSAIVAETHNTRIRTARPLLALHIAPHARRDPLIRAATGLSLRDLKELEDADGL